MCKIKRRSTLIFYFSLQVLLFFIKQRNNLFGFSDYPTDILEDKWPPACLVQADKSTGEIYKEKPLYVFKPENLGSRMSIDDKQIGRDGFTVMSNTRTGKMAMLIESRQVVQIQGQME